MLDRVAERIYRLERDLGELGRGLGAVRLQTRALAQQFRESDLESSLFGVVAGRVNRPREDAPTPPTWGVWGACGCTPIMRTGLQITAFGQTKPNALPHPNVGAVFTVDYSSDILTIGTVNVTVSVSGCTIVCTWTDPFSGGQTVTISGVNVTLDGCSPFVLRTTGTVLGRPPGYTYWLDPRPTTIRIEEV